MQRIGWIAIVIALLFCAFGESASTDGIAGLANRLLSQHGDDFEFVLTTEQQNYSRWNQPTNDNYIVSDYGDGRIRIEGTTLSALARGFGLLLS
jgi:thiamine monophosphate kinase